MQNLSLHGGGQDRLRSPIPPNLPAYFMASLYHHPMSSLDQYPGATSTGPAQDPVDRALLASRNHREAEKRRRERIKSHLDRLRTVLACDPKIDKASLLAKAVERVRDLKQLTATIPKNQNFPSEHDEIVVLPSTSDSSSTASSVPTIFEASVCCDDRADLLPELIETLHGLRMRTLRAEIATLGGRVRSVLLVARERGDDEERDEDEVSVGSGECLRDALRALVDRQMAAASDRPKRRRMVDMSLA
ncbi:transcription factor bHLH106-like protein [Carex littledalei]|uniref:Transcription factor bHLH106-like protein n=1 Tax=Carex littledalei TaxID=544730 RepID=A0A833VQ58_9POAL|nr:transcription factor bHLH106-like protein [Carex littledalei]